MLSITDLLVFKLKVKTKIMTFLLLVIRKSMLQFKISKEAFHNWFAFIWRRQLQEKKDYM